MFGACFHFIDLTKRKLKFIERIIDAMANYDNVFEIVMEWWVTLLLQYSSKVSFSNFTTRLAF